MRPLRGSRREAGAASLEAAFHQGAPVLFGPVFVQTAPGLLPRHDVAAEMAEGAFYRLGIDDGGIDNEGELAAVGATQRWMRHPQSPSVDHHHYHEAAHPHHLPPASDPDRGAKGIEETRVWN